MTKNLEAPSGALYALTRPAGRSTAPPCARRGASLCTADDGRRLWLFGGNDGRGSLGDLLCFEVEAGQWSQAREPGSTTSRNAGRVQAGSAARRHAQGCRARLTHGRGRLG
jgi:hypothetical protein